MRQVLSLIAGLAGVAPMLSAQNDSTGAPGGLSLTLMADQYRLPGGNVGGVALRGIGIRREGITTAFGIGVVDDGLLGGAEALDGELGFGASGAGRRVAFLFTGGAVGHFPLREGHLGILGVGLGGTGIVALTGRVGLRVQLARRVYLRTSVPNAWVLSVGIGLVPPGDWRER